MNEWWFNAMLETEATSRRDEVDMSYELSRLGI